MSIRIAIIGAGPAGFYAADQLLAKDFAVDLIDRLPTPFGLVRSGVAPDHPKIKTVTRVYTKTATHPAFRFFGGVELGRDISREELLARYDAVVYAYGTAEGNRLGIPGEDLRGSHTATEFVGWYNAHPDFADHGFELDCERAVVIGNGNVSLDVARMLVLAPEELECTDIADHSIPPLCNSAVREVVLLGRRGPAQAAFTNPELRELGELTQADVIVDPGELELDPASAEWLASDLADITSKKNVEILRDYAARQPSGKSHRVVLRFLRSPIEILGDEHGRVRAVRLARNRLERGEDGRLRAVPTGEEEVLECGLVMTAVGYRGQAIEGIRFDERRGLIPNAAGRVLGPDGEPQRGEYVVGWIKRGPSGVIGTNKKDAADTVASIVQDAEQGRLGEPSIDDPGEVLEWIHEHVPRAVAWQGWMSIDEQERAAGEPAGRPRVKFVRFEDLFDAAVRNASLNN